MKIFRLFLLTLTLILVSYHPVFSTSAPTYIAGKSSHQQFEEQMDELRVAMKIPGMSAAVIKDQELIWAKGFGFSDLENRLEATSDTPYQLASVTKSVAAVLIMQLVEEGVIDLDAPISQYGIDVKSPGTITVRHLLTHTSEGVPGSTHIYNGSRYALLAGVIEGATEKTFAELIGERLLLPLEMTDTALNPISAWGGPTDVLQEIQYALGWGKLFQNYPNVYLRMAQPYQLDIEYNIIEGKFHPYHNTATGLISSVNDLAKFDIALDQGLLLGDRAKKELFAPAYSTYGDRTDLMYGLGWNVQEFEGMQILWHVGCWPPSNSALYLKIPSEDLTLIVLANTANLVTPYYGIGAGDITRSALALSFFRHFVFQSRNGYALPVIDWQAGETELATQLSEIQDEASREFLERELWAYRQAYSSTGQNDLANQLERVRDEVFSESVFSNDPLYVPFSGQPWVMPPGLSLQDVLWFARGMVVWFILVAASMAWLVGRLARRGYFSLWQWSVWLLTAIFLGPFSVLVHILVENQGDKTVASWKDAISGSVFSMSVYAASWIVVLALLMKISENPHPLVTLGLAYFTPLIMDILILRAPFLYRQGIREGSRLISWSWLAAMITVNLGVAILLPATFFVKAYLLSTTLYPTNPYSLAMMSVFSVAGIAALFPVYYWMKRRGYSFWSGGILEKNTAKPESISLPNFRNTWWVLLLTFGLMLSLIILSAQSQI